ncbi:MAG TPA: amino acid permease [Gemmatimonadales bacterium]|nr:amino acid permease [Gemmatimonadales bacterium]
MTTYARRLGLFSGTMAVIGGIIGSGIFLNPAVVAGRVGTARLTLAAWIMGGAVALLGAFIFGELAARVPRVGGGYAYLRDALGRFPAFLYAWALLLMIATGAIAAVAFTFASYAGALLGLPAASLPWVAGGAIALLSALNFFGVQPAAWTQNVLTVLKLAALVLLIGAGLLLAPAASGAAAPPLAPPQGFAGVTLALATAFVPVLFAYGGWQQSNFIAEELIEPERNLPVALVLGVVGVVVVYLLANVAYVRVLGVEGLAASNAPAADTMTAVLGAKGRTLISIGILISTFGFLDLVIMVSPRVYQAMAADGLFFQSFARLHPRFRTPATAIVAQGGWACLLLATRSYGQLLDYVTFADWIFFGATAATVIVYRRRDRLGRGTAGQSPAGPQQPAGGFRLPGYPGTLALFLIAAGYVVTGSIRSNPGNALRGTGLLALGIPVFLYWKRQRSTVNGQPETPSHEDRFS